MNVVTLKIVGMKCGGCANTLMQSMLQKFPDSRFSADHVSSSGLLALEQSKSLRDHLEFIASQGYGVELLSEVQRKQSVKRLVSMAIAFFCFMNIMIFALCEYPCRTWRDNSVILKPIPLVVGRISRCKPLLLCWWNLAFSLRGSY